MPSNETDETRFRGCDVFGVFDGAMVVVSGIYGDVSVGRSDEGGVGEVVGWVLLVRLVVAVAVVSSNDEKVSQSQGVCLYFNRQSKVITSTSYREGAAEASCPNDGSTGEPAPFVVVVQGPPEVCISIKHYTKHNLPAVRGPITIVSGKQRRLQFVECPNDINGMIDGAKFADLALLLFDGSYGFEMETFDFLNILQNYGFPKVMGVLTHPDKFKDIKRLKKTKQRLKY
ncbi:ribosome biogenesis BMS1 homolog [Olea europaea subsp. europaea]|uniref:Ribosome biogenesis BMS1 homolog n=1 Tax=Olea europaea subsp. europaea TaxID=158383 RepID=A0A8S0PIP4_OLEEU|nr:ribosome biogenesis BMS1 homolog [Olea europaea subsp. europaea]